jgi:23S rRNA (guanosine2251-2'-O)-methyltransferase
VIPSRQRNDRRIRKSGGEKGPRAPEGTEWVWGRHAVAAAIANPRRPELRRLVLAPGKMVDSNGKALPRVETMDNAAIAQLLPQGAVHQGYALLAGPIEPVDLEELLEPAQGLLIMLDQVTDPQNIGNILRSAAAFGARGVIVQDRHAPPLSGALVKTAVGAADMVPVARVVNLSRALDALAEAGWRTIGLDGDAPSPLHEILDHAPTVLVLGSEGEGLRRLVGEHCDVTAHIPMGGAFESLNVATAAAIALYEASKPRRRHG